MTRRFLTLAALTMVAVAGLAAQAFADAATLTIANSQGQSDPAASLPRVFTVSGTTTQTDVHAYVKYRATGGAPCAPSADTDPGTALDGATGPFYNGSPTDNGAFSESDVITWPAPQTLMFCIWVAKTATTATTPFAQNVTFRAPNGTDGATFTPAAPMTRQPITVAIAGTSEAPKTVFATLHAAGAACAPTFATDTGQNLVSGPGQPVNGTYTIDESVTETAPGPYEVCLWLAASATDTAPVVGPQAVTFTVVNPPCIVPPLTSNTSLAAIDGAITDGNCTVGKRTFVASPKVPAGHVISLTPAPGTQQAFQAPIAIAVSTGPPCRVPVVKPGATLATTARLLTRAHCSAGRTMHAKSATVRHGRVVATRPAAGKVLASQAQVAIVLSLGSPS